MVFLQHTSGVEEEEEEGRGQRIDRNTALPPPPPPSDDSEPDKGEEEEGDIPNPPPITPPRPPRSPSPPPPPSGTDEEEEDDSFLTVFQAFSREWLQTQLTHQVSLSASNSFWVLAMKYIPGIHELKTAERIQHKIPQFMQVHYK